MYIQAIKSKQWNLRLMLLLLLMVKVWNNNKYEIEKKTHGTTGNAWIKESCIIDTHKSKENNGQNHLNP